MFSAELIIQFYFESLNVASGSSRGISLMPYLVGFIALIPQKTLHLEIHLGRLCFSPNVLF